MISQEKIRILLVEDNPADVLLLDEMFSEMPGFDKHLVHVPLLADALGHVRQEFFDIVLLDLGLPDEQGVDTFRVFNHHAPELPVLVLTAFDDAELGLLAVREGAQDYLIKKRLNPSVLSRSIRYAVERNRVARELAASEERFQLAVSGAAAGLWDWNIKTGTMYFAPRFKGILGYTDLELPNAPEAHEKIIHPDDLDRVRDCLESHLCRKIPYDVEYRMRNKEGDLLWIQSRGQALWDAVGNPYRMVGWIMDISERKRAEAQLRRSHERMRMLVARLQVIREEERTRISREVHDELGQQLSALKMDLSWLKKQVLQTADPEKAAVLSKRVREAELLVDNTLGAVRRIAVDLRPGTLDYLGLADAVRDELRRFEARAGIRTVLAVPAEIKIEDRGLATVFFRVFQELLTNIIRHARASEVEVILDHDNGELIMEVKDNGVGIPAEALNMNTSLGLLGIHERVTAHHGRVLFEGAEGKGTRVIVGIPYDLKARKHVFEKHPDC